jgi:peptidyl-prolyl cis-trans isomerase D
MIRFLQTPGPVKKIVLGGLLLLVCAAMLIYLVPSGGNSSLSFGGAQAGVVAQVGAEQVTAQDVNRKVDQVIKQQFPQAGAQAAMLRPFFASRAVDELVNQKALLAEAERLGFRASDEEVRDELEHGRYASYFFPGGKFIGQDQYENLLDQNGLTPQVFEAGVKQDILVSKLRNLVAGSATVTDLEIRREFEQRNTKVKFEYAVITQADILKTIHPSDAELKAYYDQHKASYDNSIPEKRKVQYALIDAAKVRAQTEVSRDELQAYYDQHRDDYRVPDQVNLRQIVINTPLPGPDGKVDPKGKEEAQKKADDILQQLKSGSKFEDLAKKYSQDASSAKNGGSQGWIQRGRLPSLEVEKAVFALPKGGTSGVIDAGYAFVIFHVDDKQEAQVKPLDVVKSQIEPVLKQQKAVQSADAQATALLKNAKANGLAKAAAAAGVPVVTTDWISRTDSLPGIGNASQFTEAVFNAAENAPPDQVALPQGFAVFDVTAVKPPSTPTFDEIRGRVESEFKNERATTLLAQKTQELADRAKAEHDLKKAAQELGATLKTSDFVTQDSQVPDIGSMNGAASVAFTMKPGEISGPLSNAGAGAVLSVLDRQQPSNDDFAAKKDEIRDSLLINKESELFSVFISNLRDQMQKSGKIKINQDELKKLTGAQGEEGG